MRLFIAVTFSALAIAASAAAVSPAPAQAPTPNHLSDCVADAGDNWDDVVDCYDDAKKEESDKE
ncbi:Uu.00g087060.m01.CDS01 [Anthostomella pinea]|uniref:Uu.00g087060.m01.CDS01 n=1 Tax=Anthostomella pinea TaxID=933095 RepID=A0AAI8VM90_9PEZI|nr:Uu.00g087060.m01.CDS01 [Anthostomella pinea]